MKLSHIIIDLHHGSAILYFFHSNPCDQTEAGREKKVWPLLCIENQHYNP